MVGYITLGSSDFERLLDNPFVESVDHEEFNKTLGKDVTILGTSDNTIERLSYYHAPNSDLTVITTPLQAFEYGEMLTHLNTFFARKGVRVPRQFLVGLIGHGATEGHIVAAYSSADRQTMKIFDPKVSDAVKFFAKKRDKSPLTVLRSLWRALTKPAPEQEILITDRTNGSTDKADYISLGTQSFFDPASCGYHSAATLKICERTLQGEGRLPTREDILEEIGNPVSDYYDIIHNSYSAYKVRVSFFDFFKQAFYDTFMPLLDEKQRQQANFAHYFLGWPQESGIGKKILYFFTIGFIINPIINMIRRPLEFLPNFASEVANFFVNRLIDWAPTNSAAQYVRSGLLLLTYGLQYLFKGVYIALRTVTSPISSFQAAQQLKNPIVRTILSGLSILISAAAYVSLAVFAAPALYALAGPAITPIVNTLAVPFIKLLTFIGLDIAPASAAFFTVASGNFLLAATERFGDGLLSKEKSDNSKDNSEDFADDLFDLPASSNASKSLAKYARPISISKSSQDAHHSALPEKSDAPSSGGDFGFVDIDSEDEFTPGLK
ncbi:hypothetical protein HRQ65_02320 [Tatlockia micdadei]|uniref:hypothetical protein n=1 Tax=Legionella micdadei TaxID=451 RepID=UPI00157082E6|nr:hypothetical protein [Legionella micdadei]NSL17218.1 hypothetical protein [Legionella micdadei]